MMLLRRSSEASMTEKLKDTAAQTFVPPTSGGAWATWAAAAALATLLVTAAGVASSCRSGGAAWPWCPENYTPSWKRCGGPRCDLSQTPQHH